MKALIHFTPKFNFLKSIIESNSFVLSYCQEEFRMGNVIISHAVHPMVSFSEFSEIGLKNRIITYGEYGIKMKADWVKKSNIHPVFYFPNESIATKALSALLIERRVNRSKMNNNIRDSIISLKCFTKNISGPNVKLKQTNYVYRDEREWRYIPSKKQINYNLISEDRKKYLNNKKEYNSRLKAFPLRFERKDIKTIYVTNQKEAEELIEKFKIKNELIKIRSWKKR